MKELIEKKLEEYIRTLVNKEILTSDDVYLLVFMISHYEVKETQKRNREEMEKSNEQWREKMRTMIEGVM